jgi:pseudaminic acid biosynthesis-associated methylase
MKSDNSQLALWRSAFGRDYTERNDHDKPERAEAWRRLLSGIAPRRVLEVGCNVGWNLVYLDRLGISELYGIEPQIDAVAKARARKPELNVLVGTACDLPFRDQMFDLVFTSGVLIHIAPDALAGALDEIHRVSRRWIAAIEYDATVEHEVDYRGHRGALWKRDHRAAWQARHADLRLVRRLELGPELGYDHCTAHLFEKGGATQRIGRL